MFNEGISVVAYKRLRLSTCVFIEEDWTRNFGENTAYTDHRVQPYGFVREVFTIEMQA